MEVSDYGKRLNDFIDSERRRRNLTVVAFAKQIGRSETYTRNRLELGNEWMLADIQRICKAWHVTFRWLTSCIEEPDQSESDRSALLRVLRKLESGDLALSANRDPHKYDEMQGGEER